MINLFKLYDNVEKITGDYRIRGVIVAPNVHPLHKDNRTGLSSVVEIWGLYGGSFLHIYSNKILASLGSQYEPSAEFLTTLKTFKFDFGQVEATTSDYTLDGWVRAKFYTLMGNERYVVEHDAKRGSFMHTYSALNLRVL